MATLGAAALLAVLCAAVGADSAQGATPRSTPAAGGNAHGRAAVLQATDLLPLKAHVRRFRFIAGDEKGHAARFSLKPMKKYGGLWVLTMQGHNRTYIRKNAAGGLVIVRLDLLDKNKAVMYAPPVPLLPAHIQPGRAYETSSKATVYNLKTGEQTHQGHAENRIEHVSRGRFDTPAGKIRGYMVVINHRVDLGLATVQFRLEAGYHRGFGNVYRRWTSTVEKLGMFGNTTSRAAALANIPDQPRHATGASDPGRSTQGGK